jgi:hypothetical protein
MKRLLPLLLIALLAVACSKEDVVAPCNAPSEEHVSAKDLKPTTLGDETGDTQEGISGGHVDPPSDGSGISDDGDDLSDSERSRKKRR